MEISRQGRIDELGKLLLGVQPTDRATRQAPTESNPQGSDRVEISAAAKELQRVRELTQQEDPTRTDKVAQLKQSVESGTYTVTGRNVADHLVRNTLLESVL